jgi:hypothetical protein
MSNAATSKKKGSTGLYIGAAVVGLFAAVALASAGLTLWADSAQRDDSGYVSTSSHVYGTSSRALVTEGVTVGNDVPDWLLGKVRIEATSTTGKPLFVGIAKQSDAESYLNGVRYAKLTDLDLDPFSVTYAPQPGRKVPASPAAQSFWAAKARGSGSPALTWKVREGNWSIVVMNADGSPGVTAEVKPGAKIPAAFWAGLGAAIVGGALLLVTILMVMAGARRDGENARIAAQPVPSA